MMTAARRTVTYVDDLPESARFVRHVRCGQTLTVEDVERDSDEKMVCDACEGEALGSGYGFVLVTSRRAEDALPSPLANGWTPVPHALVDHGDAVGLSVHERALIIALWRHQYGGRAYPSRAQLARETSMSARTVTRVIGGLEDRGLLCVIRPRHRGQQRASEYELLPLWDALSWVARGNDPQSRWTGSPPAGGQRGYRPVDRESTQLEAVQGEPEQGDLSDERDERGSSPSPLLAQSRGALALLTGQPCSVSIEPAAPEGPDAAEPLPEKPDLPHVVEAEALERGVIADEPIGWRCAPGVAALACDAGHGLFQKSSGGFSSVVHRGRSGFAGNVSADATSAGGGKPPAPPPPSPVGTDAGGWLDEALIAALIEAFDAVEITAEGSS